MNTTSLFVELIVIGVGAVIWLFLCVFSLVPFPAIDPSNFSTLVSLAPVLSIAYVLGIIVDRISDALFEKVFIQKIHSRYYGSKDEYKNDRRFVYLHGGSLVDLLEYGRSRLRICRGWFLNSILILVMMNLFLNSRIQDFDFRMRLSLLGNTLCLLLIASSYFAWYQLCMNDVRKVKEQSRFLRDYSVLRQSDFIRENLQP
jgi:hypothetical protein